MTRLDSVPGEVRLRQALYGGLLGSAGVVLAWTLWVVIQAWLEDWVSVVRAPAVGATVGIVVDFVSEHVKASAREVRGEPEPPADADGGSSRVRRVLGLMGTFTVIFLAGACENLVGDRLAALWHPFLVSVATFFPAGALIAWMMHARAFHSHSLLANVAQGLFVGCCAAMAVMGMGLLLGTLPRTEAGVDWDGLLALLGWWGLLGGALGFALREEDSPSLLGPAAGVGFMLVLTLLSAVPVSWQSRLPSPVAHLVHAVRPAIELALTHPGLPAQVLVEAESASKPPPLTPLQRASGGVEPGSAWGLRATRWLGCEERVAVLNPVRIVRAVELSPHRRALCNDLGRGSRSGLVRSWLVLLVFSLGLGLAHVMEARLRPEPYAGSRTQGRDGFLAAGTGLLLLVAVLVVRLVPG